MRIIKREEVASFHQQLGSKSTEEILKWAYAELGQDLGMTTAFGYSGILLMHLLQELAIDIDVYFVDTGFHFEETLELADRVRKEMGVRLHRVAADPELRSYFLRRYGERPYEGDANICCHYLKTTPIVEILGKKSAWLSALRKDQSNSRAGIDVVEMDGRGTLKIYPLAKWTREETWSYVVKRGLPYNPLHDRGFPSVGCRPCTLPVEQGGDERDGRWKSTPKLECGIHLPVISGE
ncbi:MAG: phosphoadenylyl-sulfate reductase [Deltaproteobacteria bacterium]|nr:phosphoadenylyl-sulfate reductase [Deltaproteobacteria bacterium]